MATIFNRNQGNEDKDQTQQQGTAGTGPSINAGGASATSSNATSAAPARQGSGRFTNLQSYLNANKSGGQQLAGGISNRVNKEIGEAKTESEKYNEKVAQGVQESKTTLDQGQQNLGQLQQIGQNIQDQTGAENYGNIANLGIQDFTNDPGFSRFQDIQAGTAINQDELNLNQQVLQNAANQFQNQAQGFSDQVNTESGRFDLLKQTYGGNVNPQYNRGQQRLDQLFLARQGLGDLRSDLSENVQQAQGLVNGAQATGQDINSITAAERGLIGDIGTQSMSNEDAYVNMLESYVPEINRLREQEFQDINTTIGAVNSGFAPEGTFQKATPQAASDIDFDILKNLGFSGTQQVYNVFDGLQAEDVAQRGREAQGYQDAATQTDVDRYNALAQIAGMQEQNKRIKEAADLGDAYTARSGDGDKTALQTKIDSAADSFLNFAQNQDYNIYQGTGGSDNNFSRSSGNLFDLMSGGAVQGIDQDSPYLIDPQAQQIYRDALSDLANQGYGNVLSQTRGNASNVLPTDVQTNRMGSSQYQGPSRVTPIGTSDALIRGGVGDFMGGIGGLGVGAALNSVPIFGSVLGGVFGGSAGPTGSYMTESNLADSLNAALTGAGVGIDDPINLGNTEYTMVDKEDITG